MTGHELLRFLQSLPDEQLDAKVFMAMNCEYEWEASSVSYFTPANKTFNGGKPYISIDDMP